MFRALGQYQSSTDPSYIQPLESPRWVLCKNCHPSCHPHKADPLKHFPRVHTYPVRCHVQVSIVQNAPLASSKAYQLCRGRKLAFISKTDKSPSFTPVPCCPSPWLRGQKVVGYPVPTVPQAFIPIFSLLGHLD